MGYHLVLPMAPVLSQLYVSQNAVLPIQKQEIQEFQAVDRAHGTVEEAIWGKEGTRWSRNPSCPPPICHYLRYLPPCFSPSCSLQVSLPLLPAGLNLQISVMGPTQRLLEPIYLKSARQLPPWGWTASEVSPSCIPILSESLPTPTLFWKAGRPKNKVQQQPGIERHNLSHCILPLGLSLPICTIGWGGACQFWGLGEFLA